jgi:hypothetical protein
LEGGVRRVSLAPVALVVPLGRNSAKLEKQVAEEM